MCQIFPRLSHIACATGLLGAGLPTVISPVFAGAAERDRAELALIFQIRNAREDSVSRVLTRIRQMAPDRNTLTRDRVRLEERRQDARSRARYLAFWLQKDLDGDGRVTRQEFDASSDLGLSGSGKERLQKKALQTLARTDTDKNGIVTWSEALADAKAELASRKGKSNRMSLLDALFVLDPNQDGIVTVGEARTLAGALFDRFDADGNGYLDPPEHKKRQAYIREKTVRSANTAIPRSQRYRLPCELPKPDVGDEVVLVAGLEPEAMSTVFLGADTSWTWTGEMTIEPGKKPIYLLVYSRSATIWRFKGALDRIAKVVFLPSGVSKGNGVGQIGLPRDKVVFGEARACIRTMPQKGTGQWQLDRARIETTLGRNIDKLVLARKFADISVPSGTVTFTGGPNLVNDSGWVIIQRGKTSRRERVPTSHAPTEPPEGVDAMTWGRIYERARGGIEKLDANAVVSPGAKGNYTFLPGDAGLLPLLTSGALSRIDKAYMKVEKPISQWPQRLATRRFILKKGLPTPDNFPASYCLYSEDTGELLIGKSHCR